MISAFQNCSKFVNRTENGNWSTLQSAKGYERIIGYISRKSGYFSNSLNGTFSERPSYLNKKILEICLHRSKWLDSRSMVWLSKKSNSWEYHHPIKKGKNLHRSPGSNTRWIFFISVLDYFFKHDLCNSCGLCFNCST